MSCSYIIDFGHDVLDVILRAQIDRLDLNQCKVPAVEKCSSGDKICTVLALLFFGSFTPPEFCTQITLPYTHNPIELYSTELSSGTAGFHVHMGSFLTCPTRTEITPDIRENRWSFIFSK